MGFINHHTTPVELPQLWAVGHYHLKSGDQPVKLQHAGNSVSLWTSDTIRILQTQTVEVSGQSQKQVITLTLVL